STRGGSYIQGRNPPAGEFCMSAVSLPSDASTIPAVSAVPPIKLRVPIMLVAAYVLVYFGLGAAEMGAFTRFIGRMVALGVLTLGFLGWWMLYRRVPFRERAIVLVATLAVFLVAMTAVHPSVQSLQLILLFWALPAMFAGWTLWLLVARQAAPQ